MSANSRCQNTLPNGAEITASSFSLTLLATQIFSLDLIWDEFWRLLFKDAILLLHLSRDERRDAPIERAASVFYNDPS